MNAAKIIVIDLSFRVIGCNTGANQPERRRQPINDINLCLLTCLQHLTKRNQSNYTISLLIFKNFTITKPEVHRASLPSRQCSNQQVHFQQHTLAKALNEECSRSFYKATFLIGKFSFLAFCYLKKKRACVKMIRRREDEVTTHRRRRQEGEILGFRFLLVKWD